MSSSGKVMIGLGLLSVVFLLAATPAADKKAIQGASKPVGPYSPGVDIGSLVFVAGQIGLDPATGTMVGGGDRGDRLHRGPLNRKEATRTLSPDKTRTPRRDEEEQTVLDGPRHRGPKGASPLLEGVVKLLRQRIVEVGRHDELSRREADRTTLPLLCRNRTDLGDGAISTSQNDAFRTPGAPPRTDGRKTSP